MDKNELRPGPDADPGHTDLTDSTVPAPDAVAPGERCMANRLPLNVRYEFVVVDGPEGKLLRQKQAAVMREVLQWLHDNPASPSPAGHVQQAPEEDV